MASKVLVKARDRRGKALPLPSLRATYDKATSAIPDRPSLFLEPKGIAASFLPNSAEAWLRLSIQRSPNAFAALLRGLLEVSRKHRDVELFVETPGAQGFDKKVAIFRGAFERGSESAKSWLDGFDATPRPRGSSADAPKENGPTPGAERIGELGALRELLHGIPFALAHAGAVYLPDGPETARRITPPGRFAPTVWSQDRRRLAVIGRAEGGESSVWISREGSGAQALISLDGPGDPTGVAFSPDGASIAVSMSNGRLAILTADGASVASIQLGKNIKLFDPAWSPSADLVACVTEDASRARTLHVVSVAEGKKGERLLGVDAPASDDQSLADPEFSEDGAYLYVRGLWGAKGEARLPRLLRVALGTGKKPVVDPVGPMLSRVQLRGGVSRWRDGRLFIAGIGPLAERANANTAWLTATQLEPGADVTSMPIVSAPKGARQAFGAPDRSTVFMKRTADSTRLWRVSEHRKYEKVRLPFAAWLCLA